MIDILLKYILWYEFLNDLDAQSDFDKILVTQKLVKQNHSYLKYALDFLIFYQSMQSSTIFHSNSFQKSYLRIDLILSQCAPYQNCSFRTSRCCLLAKEFAFVNLPLNFCAILRIYIWLLRSFIQNSAVYRIANPIKLKKRRKALKNR